MSNKQNNKKNKHILLKSTMTASLLLTPTAFAQTHHAHASETKEDITHDLKNHQQIKTKDILNKEKKQKIKGVDNKKVNVAKEETGSNLQRNTDDHGTYNEPFKYKDNFYEFGQGSSLSGAMKALDMEKNMPDKAISSSQLKVQDKTNIANITVPGKEKNVLNTGSAVAISKHALLTNNHVIRKDETKGFEHHDEKDINIYPQRDGDQIPYKLKPKKVDMLKSADASILYVDEDLSKIMDITPMANEKDIENMKENSDISIQGYPTGKRHENQVKYPNQFGHVFDAKSKFLMNATNIHPIMYYKAYTESGMSGSPVLNKDGKLIGIHAGVIDSNNGNNGDTSYGYTFTKNFRKDLIEKIPELNEKATSESKKDDDIKENQDENKKENDNKTSKNDNEKSQDKEVITPSKDVKNTSNKNEAKAAETDQPKAEKDQSKSDDENHIKDENPNEKSTQSNNKETTDNDTKSNNDKEDNQSTKNTSDKNNQKDKESSDANDSHKKTIEEQPSENINTSNDNQTSKNDNTKSDDSKQEDQKKSEKETDHQSNDKKDEKSKDKNAKTHHSLGHIDKDKEEKTVANSKSKNDNDKEQATSETKKDDDDSSENSKEKPKKETSETTASPSNEQPVHNEKPEAENKNNQAPNDIEQATSEEPEQPKDHQTFKGLPDTGSTTGNVSLLAVTLTGVAGIAILGAQSLRKWRKNKINDID